MATPYQLIGGEEKVRELAKEFYDVMSSDTRFEPIRNMHAESLDKVKEELFGFLSGWLGGPHLYFKKHGKVCLDDVHSQYDITKDDRDLWLSCMYTAMKNVGVNNEVIEMVKGPLFDLADTIKNK